MISPVNIETLEILQEECAEVIQAVSKIKRFGTASYHPTDRKKKTNIRHLEEEIGQVLCMIELMVESGFIDGDELLKSKTEKLKKLKQWTKIFD